MIKYLNIILALIGATFCLLTNFGIKILPCETSGCSVYSSFGIGGISFYTFGFLFFITLYGLLQLNKNKTFLAVLSIGAYIDALFLIFQTLFLPCLNCMFVAIIIGFLVFRNCNKLVFYIWAIAFILSLPGIWRETAKPWAVYGNPDKAEYEIFFSLTCPKCEETLQQILSNSEMTEKVVLYPVSKNEEDTKKMEIMYCGLKHGNKLYDSLAIGWGIKDCDSKQIGLSFVESMILDFRLFWNKSILLSRGHKTVPILISSKLYVVKEQCTNNDTNNAKNIFSIEKNNTNSTCTNGIEQVGCSILGDK